MRVVICRSMPQTEPVRQTCFCADVSRVALRTDFVVGLSVDEPDQEDQRLSIRGHIWLR